MKRRYEYRFYPTKEQETQFSKLFGCVRVAWNDAVANARKTKYEGFCKDSANLTASKKTAERSWLKEVSAVPLQQTLRHLEVAWKKFFAYTKAKSSGKKVRRVGKPKFKKRTSEQSAEFTNSAFKLTDGVLNLAKIGNIFPRWSRGLPSKPSSLTIRKDCTGAYFVSFVVEVVPRSSVAENQSCGIDLGIETFATVNGQKFKSPNYSKLTAKIASLQKKLSRQLLCITKGQRSNRLEATRIRIARLHKRIANQRKDFLHKLTTWLVKSYESIKIEDLNVSGLMKNRKLARSIGLQGWYTFREMLKSKCEEFGRNFEIVDRWFASSQICSVCGYRWGKLDLKQRTVECECCGSVHDRDENASHNIRKYNAAGLAV